jgi:hypothetical protein
MITIGRVTGQEIKENRNGAADVRLLMVRISNDSDIQTVQYMPMSGDDSPPQNGDLVAIISIGPAFKVAIGVQDSVVPEMDPGEKKLFSRDSGGAIAAFVNFLAGGNLELNGNDYSAVRYQELETAFNQLKSDFNNLVTAYNAHSHTGVTVGAGVTGSPVAAGVPSEADISPAESDTVKIK